MNRKTLSVFALSLTLVACILTAKTLLKGTSKVTTPGTAETLGRRELHVHLESLHKTVLKVLPNQPTSHSSRHRPLPNTSSGPTQCDIQNPAHRFDCHPEVDASQAACESRGCCWMVDKRRTKPLHATRPDQTLATPDIPACFYPNNYAGYSMLYRTDTTMGFSAILQTNASSYYPDNVKTLSLEVMFEEDNRLHVKIKDARRKRYEVPYSVPRPSTPAAHPQYTISVSQIGEPFYLTVSRKTAAPGSQPIFSTKGTAPLIFTDQFLQLSSVLNSPRIYGIGEHMGDLLLNVNWTRRTLWNQDWPPVEGKNLYGSHPFYLVTEKTGRSNGFFLLNSNAMDVSLQPYPAVTWRTIGGILDFYIFTGDSPAQVVGAYTDVIGKPAMPPYWALGFHLCRFGYKTTNQTMMVADNLRKYGIPQDVQWNDIDYAVGMRDFTTDTERFGDQAAMVEELHSRGMHYVIITDPGISNSQKPGTYRPYDYGIELDIFLKNDSGQPLTGEVWPGTTVWVDFLHTKAQQYWTTMIKEFHDKVPIDGLWIDMNEVSNFAHFADHGPITDCPDNKYNNPPYQPDVVGGKLYARTICPSALHQKERSYNVHNLYGYLETVATNNALREVRGKRPFIISRSTYSGQGHFGGHWSGDNAATFHSMYRSISEILNMNLLGIPLAGADICGFHFNTTYNLCLRWHQLGAFYPYSRNHNDMFDPNIPQDPASFDAYFALAVRKVYLTRYSLLPLLYTLYFQSHTMGWPVARAMFYEFPKDAGSAALDKQFMWGESLLIAPVIKQYASTVDVYFPPGTLWYNFYTGEPYKGSGHHVTFPAPLDTINLFVQSGTILPMQEPALTTTESRKNPFELLVATGEGQMAEGMLYWDDGDSLDTLERHVSNLILFSLNESTLQSAVQMKGYPTTMSLARVTVFGCNTWPRRVLMNGIDQYFTYKQDTQVLSVPSLNPAVDLLESFVLDWGR